MTGTDIQIRSGRSARSLPEERSLALRERERSEGSGERSRPHPTSLAVRSLPRREPPPSLRSGDYSRRELLGDRGPTSSGSAFDRGHRKFFEAPGLTVAARVVSRQGGGTRRGSAARSEGSGTRSSPHPGEPRAGAAADPERAGATLVVDAVGEPGAGLAVAVDSV